MKLLVVGSRSITDFDLSPHIPPEVDTIISGGAGGVDTLAEEYADRHRLSKGTNYTLKYSQKKSKQVFLVQPK